MSPVHPRPLERMLRRLLMFWLMLPLAIALVGMILISAALVWQATVRQQESLARTLASRVQDHLHSAGQVLTAAGGIAQDDDLDRRFRNTCAWCANPTTSLMLSSASSRMGWYSTPNRRTPPKPARHCPIRTPTSRRIWAKGCC